MNSTIQPVADRSARCLDDRQMLLSVHWLSNLLIGRVVPVLILFGISGNILNLTVLLARNMRTRSNVLLACLAVADVVFLFCMIPDVLANYNYFSFNYFFRRFYLANKIHLLHFLNWSSASAIWLILVICVERLMGIRYPLSVRKHKRLLAPAFLVSFIVMTTGILTFYNHVSYHCESRVFCNGTQFHAFCMHVDSDVWFPNQGNPNPQWFRLYVRWSPQIHALFVVFIPAIMVAISNVLLIVTMRQRQKFFTMANNSSEQTSAQLKTEQKVTITVCSIVTCFTITQGPSAVIPILASLTGIPLEKFATHTAVVTTMVVLGKAINFILFCLSSANFRQRLMFRTKQSILRRKTTNRRQSITATTRLDSMAYSPNTPLVNNGRQYSRGGSLNRSSKTKPRAHTVSEL